ncbi:MAG: metallophosphoesterase [Mangrovibacterium sp.]
MRGISSGFVLVFLFTLLVEVLGYLGITQLLYDRLWKKRISGLYLLFSLFFLGFFLYAFGNPDTIRETGDYGFFYFVIFISTLNLVPKLVLSVFVLLASPFRLKRDKTLAHRIVLGGLILSFGVILCLGAGYVIGKNRIQIREISLNVSGLPSQLEGLKFVQLSDLQLGSFQNDRLLRRMVRQINRVNADLILFTGDLVNNFSREAVGFEEELLALSASSGKYAILGNHDYGDYSDWPTAVQKQNNRELIKKKIRDSGFTLLLNQTTRISMCDTAIYLTGVENWGHPPFPQYARLDKALSNVPEHAFQILMTHDPAHWNAQVIGQTTIQLTLSGHTHGGQFAVRLAGLSFSPIRLKSPEWGGLYKKNGQFLYVNRGFGCVGLPARIDMAPEITVFDLHASENTKTR